MKRIAFSLLAALTLAGCGTTGLPGSMGPQEGNFFQAAARAHGGVKDGPYTLITQPDGSASKAIFQSIDQAKRSIDLTMYILMDPDVVTHLAAASARGVQVRVLLERDPFYSNPSVVHRPVPQPASLMPLLGLGALPVLKGYSSNQQAASDIQAKTHAARTPALVYWTNDSRFALTHEKGMVIDNAAAFIMSNNFTSAGLGANREYAVIDQVPGEVQEVEAIFQADVTNTVYHVSQPNLVVSPDDGSGQGNAKTKIMALIASAHQTLQIQDEEFQDPDIAKELGQKVAAGVSVKVMLSPSAKAVANPYLLPQGITPVYWNPTGGELHAKLIIADGHAAYLGSINLSTQSMGYNRELGIQLADPAILQALTGDFTADWNASAHP
jgi:cardiolipin synthase